MQQLESLLPHFAGGVVLAFALGRPRWPVWRLWCVLNLAVVWEVLQHLGATSVPVLAIVAGDPDVADVAYTGLGAVALLLLDTLLDTLRAMRVADTVIVTQTNHPNKPKKKGKRKCRKN